jgi:site-specific recombinase XerD
MKSGKTYPIEVLSQAEINAMVRACGASRTGLRKRAMIALLYRGALRASEAMALFPKDVDGDGTIRILRGKGSKARTIQIDPGATAIVEQWLATRRDLGIGPQVPILCTLDGKPLHYTSAGRTLRRLAKKAGITKRVHPHGLRHSRAYEMHMVERIPILVISKFLGHSSVASTAVYIEHLAPAETMAITRASAWSIEG